MKFTLVTIFISILFIAATLTTNVTAATLNISTIPAFPGAQGFGTKTRGAYGGGIDPIIYKVTNLNAYGTGSLAYGLADISEPRVIIFEVSGTIELTSWVRVDNPYVTVAGQTAPSPGITLKGAGIYILTHDVIIQHIRIRVGDSSNGPTYSWRDNLDIGESGKLSYNVVIDHCSFSWATDENTGTWYPTHDVTYQWCIISEGLDDSYHPEGPHSMGMLIGPESYRTSIHHNLYANNANRNPLVGGYGETEIINNVVYNWVWGSTEFQHYSGAAAQYGNIIGNYYKAGKNTLGKNQAIMVYYATAPSKFYIHDNIGPARTSNNQDDWAIVLSSSNRDTLRSNTPAFQSTGIATQTAFDAYDAVLTNAGARPGDRDSVDKRIVGEVKMGSGQIIDSQKDVGGWPTLAKNYRALAVPSNPHGDSDGDGYTNLEEWLQSYAAEIETITSINYTTETENQSSNNQPTDTQTQPSSNQPTDTQTQPSSNQPTDTQTQPSDNQPTDTQTQPSDNQATETKNRDSNSHSSTSQKTNPDFTTKSAGFLGFMEKFYDNLTSLSDLIRFELQ